MKGPIVSRRFFLKGASVSLAGAAACAHTEAGRSGGERSEAVSGPGELPVTLTVNGEERQLRVEPRTTLADALRAQIGLTGTKVVCDRGACSACTVYMDGTPVLACSTLAIEAQGHAITTIEGLAPPGGLHPVQEAFIEHDALQCGFCTPGMVMSCAALLNRNPKPSLDDVKEAVSGNLCRCGTYPKVFAATLAAAKGGRS